MSTEPGKRFTTPQRLVLGMGLSLAAVAALVLAYRLTAPERTPARPGAAAATADDILRVGALPVT